MEFRLFYDGPLKSNRGASDKHALRRVFHLQLKELLSRKAMKHVKSLIENEDPRATFRRVGCFTFAPLITEKLEQVVGLHITMLTPEEPGRAVTKGGDLDNRLKTLLDALRSPRVADEIPKGASPSDDESPFYCLLEDDALLSQLSVTSDRLLRPDENSSNVVLIIHVLPKATLSQLGTTVWI
jgi:hypothetical protein